MLMITIMLYSKFLTKVLKSKKKNAWALNMFVVVKKYNFMINENLFA